MAIWRAPIFIVSFNQSLSEVGDCLARSRETDEIIGARLVQRHLLKDIPHVDGAACWPSVPARASATSRDIVNKWNIVGHIEKCQAV